MTREIIDRWEKIDILVNNAGIVRDDLLPRIPLKRFGTPDDVAELVAFLAGERASYITAQVICIDGGVI